ncbi:MAG: efflux RND transporter permease subunit, partial [Planctomycetaceae bacterium]|nr:efflux RND transporter permease subunit [Planctomycetaceae bacterium]
PVVIRLSGPGFADLYQMQSVATELTSLLKTEPETWDINDSWGAATYQVSVDIDEERSKLAGVSNSQIAQILNAYYSGQKLTTFREGDHQIPIYFRLRQNLRDDLSGLTAAHVEGASGKIPISSVASFSTHRVPAKIERRDMNRTIEIRSQVETGAMGNEIVKRILGSAEVAGILEKLPPGYRIEAGGALEESQDASVQMLTSFSMSILLITLLLVIQYNGIIKPIIILTTLPLALIGALPGLYFTDNPIGFMPQLGILSLFGIVLNTGIIFIEFADTLIQERMSKSSGVGPIGGLTVPELRQCLIDAGKLRMLPIFLTTATTVGGLLPLALAGGPLWEGMAWCMIYGLLVATLLTLFVVPALYAIVIEWAKRPL